jgi:hypothetical protein
MDRLEVWVSNRERREREEKEKGRERERERKREREREEGLVRVWPLDFADFLIEAKHDGPIRSLGIK